MDMDLQAVSGKPCQMDMARQGFVNVGTLTHEALVLLQDAIQLVKVLHTELC